MWNQCGMSRNATGSISHSRYLRFGANFGRMCVYRVGATPRSNLEKAGRVSDFETRELMCKCTRSGGIVRRHFPRRAPTQKAKRCVAARTLPMSVPENIPATSAVMRKEDLAFEYVKLAQRSYK